MSNIHEYLKLSETANSIQSLFSSQGDLVLYYRNVQLRERKAVIRHFIVNNVPFVFRCKPILFEQLTQYLSEKLDVATSEIKLIGSAKTGYSMSPPPKWGMHFGPHSDLDFSFINEKLFATMMGEFNNWSELYQSDQIRASNMNEQTYWSQNMKNVPGQLKRGFIDSHFIPNREQFRLTRTVNNNLWFIKKGLQDFHGVLIKKASARIYKNWKSFYEVLNFNIENVVNRLQ